MNSKILFFLFLIKSVNLLNNSKICGCKGFEKFRSFNQSNHFKIVGGSDLVKNELPFVAVLYMNIIRSSSKFYWLFDLNWF